MELAGLAERVSRVRSLAEERTAEAGGAPIPVEAVQELLALAVTLYADRTRKGPGPAASASQAVTATEAMVATVAMLRAIDIDLYDFILWSGRA